MYYAEDAILIADNEVDLQILILTHRHKKNKAEYKHHGDGSIRINKEYDFER